MFDGLHNVCKDINEMENRFTLRNGRASWKDISFQSSRFLSETVISHAQVKGHLDKITTRSVQSAEDPTILGIIARRRRRDINTDDAFGFFYKIRMSSSSDMIMRYSSIEYMVKNECKKREYPTPDY